MPLEHGLLVEIQKALDDRYVSQKECTARQNEINKKLANDDKRIDLILYEQKQMRAETKSALKFNNWLTFALLGALVAGFVGFYFFFGK